MSSGRRLRRAACEGKVRYADRAAAHVAVRGITARTGGYLHVYRCPHCHGWHIGHYKPGVRP